MAKKTKEKKEKKVKKEKIVKQETPAQRLSGIIKSCRNIMRKDKGMNGDGDRLPMLTWIMFLKFLDDNEYLQETNAQLEGKKYKAAIEEPYRWRDWAKDKNLTGDDLLAFISNENVKTKDGKDKTGLLYYLRGLQSEKGTERKDVIATVFRGVTNRMINGYLLRDVVNKIDEIHFTNNEEINTLSHLYESILKEMRDASGDAGEFYTPRPVVKFMVEMLDPQIGETVLDPAAGTGGFLVESFEHLKKQAKTIDQGKKLQSISIIGGEAKSLPYLLCQMNLLLHGLNYPNIDPLNSLRFPLKDIGDKDRVDVILTNPPFGGEEEKGILNNFPDDKKTAETALLFLQLIMRKLKKKKPNEKGGRAAVVVPNGTLFAEGISARVKKQMLDDFNLHTIVRLGEGVFAPYTSIPCNLLFFEAGGPTKEIWYYELLPPTDRKNYSKTKPIQNEEFIEIKKWWGKREENDNAWKVKLGDVLRTDEEGKLLNVNLDLKNPNRKSEFEYKEPSKLVTSILDKEKRIMQLMKEIENEINLEVITK
jgi:type I restriction enzyme M protein